MTMVGEWNAGASSHTFVIKSRIPDLVPLYKDSIEAIVHSISA